MPLPANGTPWPPKALHKITPVLRQWDAWYSGDAVQLANTYGYLSPGVPGYPAPPAVYRTGVRGAIARWFWGQPNLGQQLSKLHVPVAADICQASADLLFAVPAAFTVKDTTTQDRLLELTDDTFHGVVAEGAEIGAALGGHYLRVSWDQSIVPGKPFITCVHADAAWPEFAYGRLRAATFWTRLATDGDSTVWRHLERHELDAAGNGIVLHGLYQGGENDLGKVKPLTERPETAPLAQVVTDGNMISTGTPGLAVEYFPNQRPQRKWRNDPIGADLGRSDLDGVEHLMDALDETYSSWMRDIRLGKGRVFVARSLLENNDPGKGAAFDMDQEVFAPLNMLQDPTGGGSGMPIQAEQFAIRYAEHKATADQLLEAILRTAGYSSQTFGMDSTGGKASNMTATEVQAHERRSYLTRDRKIRLYKPRLQRLTQKLLAVDALVFNSGVKVDADVQVAFSDAAQESQITLAQTAAALKTAGAASTQTLVAMVHPDWDDDEVQKEVERIHDEEATAVPDPGQFGDPSSATDPADTGDTTTGDTGTGNGP